MDHSPGGWGKLPDELSMREAFRQAACSVSAFNLAA
jgi:hypothetical protein